jgi:hypothetical protein
MSLSDADFLHAFESCTLPATSWTHTAHVRLAWLRLNQVPYEAALESVRHGIQSYNNAVLKKEGAYHETITVAFMRLVNDAKRNGVKHFADLECEYPWLLDRKLSALLEYYSRDRLFSAEARSGYIEPDLKPLPAVH